MLADAHLYLIFTPSLCAGDPWETLDSALTGGVDLVQWRVPEPDPADLARCMHICNQHGVKVIVNDQVQLAKQLDAAGAHVGQGDMAPARARKLLGKKRWLGISTHSVEQLTKAEAAGADYVGLGPCFPTETKSYTEGLPRDQIAAAVEAATVPLFAIGGVHRLTVPILQDLGVKRVAVSSAILRAERPGDIASRLRSQLVS